MVGVGNGILHCVQNDRRKFRMTGWDSIVSSRQSIVGGRQPLAGSCKMQVSSCKSAGGRQ